MGITLKGKIAKKLRKKLKDAADKEKKKWPAFVRKLLKLASGDPGKRLAKEGDDSDLKRIKLKIPKKLFKEVEDFMDVHGLTREDVLGPAIMRGWELYSA